MPLPPIVYVLTDFAESTLDDWAWILGVNLMGVVHGIRTFLPIMIEQGEEAHIVNTASLAGLITGGSLYGVTKSAVIALSGMVALAMAMGIGRFAFTPMLPMMQVNAGLSVAAGGC